MTFLARAASALLTNSLALFPARYRREYGEERACVTGLALEAAAAQGFLWLLQFCARECRDLPLALLREHSKEWRQRMNGSHQVYFPSEEHLSGRQLFLFLVPFLAVLIVPLGNWIGSNFWSIPALGLLAAVLGLTIVGLLRGLPRWALPSLGLMISIANLIFLNNMLTWADPIFYRLRQLLWTHSVPGRMLFALIVEMIDLMPTLLLLVILALLSGVSPALSAFRWRLGQDWTLLPFLLYATRLMTPLYADAYRGLELYQLFFILILAAGAWFYLNASRLRSRIALLLTATLLSSLVLCLGIYLVYPFQTWVNDVVTDFPRWWEGINPLFSTFAMLAGICLIAVFGHSMRQEKLTGEASA